jgi:hypothetical protein
MMSATSGDKSLSFAPTGLYCLLRFIPTTRVVGYMLSPLAGLPEHQGAAKH